MSEGSVTKMGYNSTEEDVHAIDCGHCSARHVDGGLRSRILLASEPHVQPYTHLWRDLGAATKVFGRTRNTR